MKRLKLHHWILLAMVFAIAIGLPLNLLDPTYLVVDDQGSTRTVHLSQIAADFGRGLGDIFLRLLTMVVVPLVVSSLITGVTSMGGPRQLGRFGARALLYYAATSILAITAGILMVNLIDPGGDVDLSILRDHAQGARISPEIAQPGSMHQILWNQLISMIPSNPIEAASSGDMLAIIFFSIMLGVFISASRDGATSSGEQLARFFAALFDVMMKMTLFLVHLAPAGVFGFMLYAAAGKGLAAFEALGWYVLTVFLALAVHACITLPLLLRFLAGRAPMAFAKAMMPALLTAFSTASSSGTLPLTISCAEQRAGISNRVCSFVLPLGATVNMDGTGLYEVVAVLFIAQVSGIDLSVAQQVVVALTALLVSIGAAGIPHAGMVMMVVVLQAVGLDVSLVGLILAVDRVLDMLRTSVNVWSDSTAAAFVAHLDKDSASRKAGLSSRVVTAEE
ncbi:MAG: dicarboxylate/amino acid:cation symporter [Myxococcota bacterium]